MILNNILLGLTTTEESDWKAKIEETKKLDLKEIALFPTCLNLEERKILYELLKESPIRSIPHVHIRAEDFEIWELKYLHENYGTIFFNVHDEVTPEILAKFADFKQFLYLENSGKMLANFTETLNNIEGLCVDFAHLDYARRTNHSEYFRMIDLIKKHPIGCCHLSAEVRTDNHNGHHPKDPSEYDYLKNYLNLVPNIISLEIENTLTEQLAFREYLEKMISREALV